MTPASAEVVPAKTGASCGERDLEQQAIEASVTEQQAGRPGRSLLVTLIALFEFARAALILLIGLSPWILRGADLVSNVAVQVVTANDPRDPFLRVYPWHVISDLDDILGLLGCALLAVPFAVLGWGVLRLKRWGRVYAAATSALIVVYWMRGLIFNWALPANPDYRSRLTMSTLWMVLFLNGTIFLYLMFGRDVAEHFGEKE